MSSKSYLKYQKLRKKSSFLKELVTQGIHDSDEKQVLLHAALTSYISSWDAYLNNLALEFFNVIFDPKNPKYLSLYNVALNLINDKVNKFNTPNYENSRNFLFFCTGYDPISDWTNINLFSSNIQVKNYLNEIVKVRHSFAHGVPIPKFSWNQNKQGHVRLTKKDLNTIDSFIYNLVKKTDTGITLWIVSNYGILKPW